MHEVDRKYKVCDCFELEFVCDVILGFSGVFDLLMFSLLVLA